MAEIISLLNQALKTELSSVHRSKRHYYASLARDHEDLRERFLEHAIDEAQHADQIAERICELGGHPEYESPVSSDGCNTLSVLEMIDEDISAEKIAVDTYSKMIRSIGDGDPVTRCLLEHILDKETEHATAMARLKRENQAGA
jgi:bacterioferritin